MMHKLLEIQNLSTYYRVLRGYVKAVENVSFHVNEGEAFGLAGESGCGKTTLGLSILRILPPGGFIKEGKILFEGKDLVRLDDETLRTEIRWKKISMIFQGAMNALNPVLKIGDQISEAIMIHEPEVSKRQARERTAKLLELVGIDPSRMDNYPHEFSGGMKQRAMIAMALACNPKLVIADEPITALDVVVQAQVMRLLKELSEKLNLSLILITHDLSAMAETCDRVAIMYAGKIVELGDVLQVFKEPLHPYTQGLIAAFPDLYAKKTKLVSIPGQPPDLLNPPPGCRFHVRCKYAMEICKKEEPKLLEVGKDHYVACHLVG
ncbi:MAG: ABC transporter ATP-binding protein [Candidatus Baldrarchaeia archaeon]|nr:ABC transporter ATP-binding protein [Candidatus Bathyarchaeota archaeon]HEX69245.1 ABC transporter ATP-binding protein [Candidatus Bathyarchaeota archaeon]